MPCSTPRPLAGFGRECVRRNRDEQGKQTWLPAALTPALTPVLKVEAAERSNPGCVLMAEGIPAASCCLSQHEPQEETPRGLTQPHRRVHRGGCPRLQRHGAAGCCSKGQMPTGHEHVCSRAPPTKATTGYLIGFAKAGIFCSRQAWLLSVQRPPMLVARRPAHRLFADLMPMADCWLLGQCCVLLLRMLLHADAAVTPGCSPGGRDVP